MAAMSVEQGKLNLAALRNAIKQEEERVNKVIEEKQKDIDEHKALIKRLDDLPKKLRHEIMVPFGSVGFMPGRIVRTNEVLQLVGDGYFVERSCFEANECLKRRLSVLRDIIDDCNKEKKLMSDQLSYAEQLFSSEENKKDEVDIMEPYDEEKEAEFRRKRMENVSKTKSAAKEPATSKSEQDTYIHRLAELEQQEKDNNELESAEIDESDDLKPPPGISKEEYKRFLESLGDDESSDDEAISDEEQDDASTSPNLSPQKPSNKQDHIDSDDTENEEEEEVLIKEAKSKDSRKRSVTFAREIEISHPIRVNDPVTEVKIAKDHVSGRRDSILRNKDAKIELDEEALAAVKLDEDRPRVLPSSQAAFSGIFVERQTTDILDNKPEISTESTSKPVSKFKRQRAKE